jgi:hypothetical protein
LSSCAKQGIEKQLQAHGKATEYPFHGFVIENVNDSLTMAKAGVWADHVQVQKLSTLLKRPLELYTFDDVSLRMDRQGKYVSYGRPSRKASTLSHVHASSSSGCVPARTT